jgi:vacuolar-type H+-ATPase subunit H
MPVQLQGALIEFGVGILGILFTVLVGFAVNYLKLKSKKIKDENVRQTLAWSLDEAEKVADKSIATVQQTFVKNIREASEDGNLTDKEKRDALTKAKQVFINTASNETLDVIRSQTDNFDKWVADYLEAKIYEKSGIKKEIARISNPK